MGRLITISMQGGAITQKLDGTYLAGSDLISGFLPDGSIRPDWRERLIRLLDATDRAGICVNVQAFYQRRDHIFDSEARAKTALRDLIDFLLDPSGDRSKTYAHATLELANEMQDGAAAWDFLKRANLPTTFDELRAHVAEHHPGRDLLMTISTPGSQLVPAAVAAKLDFYSIHGNGRTVDELRTNIRTLKRRNPNIL